MVIKTLKRAPLIASRITEKKTHNFQLIIIFLFRAY